MGRTLPLGAAPIRAPVAVALLALALGARAEAKPVEVRAPAPLPFASGERTDLVIHYLGIRVGKGSIGVGPREGLAVPIALEARTGGIASLFDIRERFTSWLDVETRLPSQSVLVAKELGDDHTDTTRFERETGRATVVVQRKGRRRVTRVEIPPGTLDFVSLVFVLRTLPLADGDQHSFPVLASSKVATVVAQVVGREEVSTPGGTFRCVRVRVPTGLSGKFSEKDPTFVWLSDDARRIPVRITTNFAIGRAVATLTGYRSGG